MNDGTNLIGDLLGLGHDLLLHHDGDFDDFRKKRELAHKWVPNPINLLLGSWALGYWGG